jgi:hypothetical protein
MFYWVTYNQQTYIPVNCSTNGLETVHINCTSVKATNGDRQINDLTKTLKPITSSSSSSSSSSS